MFTNKMSKKDFYLLSIFPANLIHFFFFNIFKSSFSFAPKKVTYYSDFW